jgi:hypothetical protein
VIYRNRYAAFDAIESDTWRWLFGGGAQIVTERRRTVTNDTDRLMLVFVEPEGWDCWLRPGESAELRAKVESPTNDFDITDNDDGITAWPSPGMGTISLWQGNSEIQCGYQRPAGWPRDGG